MKHIILTLGIFGMTFLVSCENSTEADTQEIHEHNDQVSSAESGVYSSVESIHEDGSIELNNGEKWKVNEEMKPFVTNGQELVTHYIESGDEDFSNLAEMVVIQNNQLISSCTMDGESHDQLHNWLHPHLELTNELRRVKTQDQANHAVKLLERSYKLYHKYFN